MKIYAVTRCVKRIVKKDDSGGGFAKFHFRGFFLGQKVNSILVNNSSPELRVGEDYFILLELINIRDNTLYCRCLECKALEDIEF
ncbi:MAG: hypothetical protein HOE90_07940 [Bacteriovoracaceae bacterium]|nr:hypothetical protein [Bacteriovoracaceae bacterium]